jgi:hypothetical protein
MKKYIMLLPLLMALLMAGCSDDDGYQAAEPLAADNQQVHFSGDNSELSIIDPLDPSTYHVNVTVARNTTHGTLAVPVSKGSDTTPGVTISDTVTFNDGDSLAYIQVSVPDTVTSGSYYYSLTLNSDQIDPYSKLDGGYTFQGTISYPKHVTFTCWINGLLTDRWTEDALSLGDGAYLISDFMHSGYALNISVKNGDLNITVHGNSELYQESASYGNLIYWYVDDWVTLYPYGKDADTYIKQFCILNGEGYKKYTADTKFGWFYLEEVQTNTMADAVNWLYFCFTIND